MSAPKRIQRRRTKGWRMPEGAIAVGRPSRWGNPFSAHGGSVIGPRWFDVKDWPLNRGVRHVDDELLELYSSHAPASNATPATVDLFRGLVRVRLRDRPDETRRWLAPLVGRDLACWCPLDQPCHADVLLHAANQEPEAEPEPDHGDWPCTAGHWHPSDEACPDGAAQIMATAEVDT